MFGLEFESTINVGNFLTFVTLLFGFLGAGYNAVRSWQRKAEEEAKSGALRLLLHILRERSVPITFADLKKEFDSAERREQRRAYCGSDWRFKNETTFEAAIYQLDWEGKIDFLSPHEIVFRLDRPSGPMQKFHPTEKDVAQIVAILSSALANPDVRLWELEDIVNSSMRVDPKATSTILRDMLHNQNPAIHGRAAAIIGKFLPDMRA